MDVLIPIIIFVLVFILFSICGFCCKRKREGTVYGPSPVVVPPYPVEPRHPTPQSRAAPAPGFATHTPPYPTHNPHPLPAPVPGYYPLAVGATPVPYPPAGAAPYPPAVGPTPYPPAGPPYPPGTAPYPDYGAQPPSYSEAVSQPPVQPLPAKEGYTKQAPYNPNY
ncbi:nematocyst expressed protein 4 isoform X3 [Tribolium castaneum]|uniref:nematocyst expressed protein 4 isoform X3 n=1 Tax=Tribolium castaneum TaxID=7070 RepID=UPI00046C3363|nr:PREDICTED: extensin-like isoform X3 [Tribolium castaneum]|eukprot:XP_008195909.1 PREDICTED: extensin-like isoform X3 [Tribolium castaneum]